MPYCIEASHLKKTFGQLKAVDDLSFKVEQGELFGFLGINGAGKSTAINILCTLLTPSEGEVEVSGYKLGKNNKEIRKKIGVVFQGNTLDEHLTIRENLMARAYLYENRSSVVKKNMGDVCDILDIHALLDRRFKELSGGQKRKCEIARALLHKPDILFLDEPTTGLDPRTRKLVWENIEQLRKETQMTVFLTTHYMEEAVRAKHIAIIDAGKMVAFDAPYKLKEDYATDLLKIVPKEKQQAISILKQEGLKYREEDHRLYIEMPSSMASISLLNQLQSYIEAFEVVQGTMEDAFLNITGKSLEEV